jgi:hypothetical protein
VPPEEGDDGAAPDEAGLRLQPVGGAGLGRPQVAHASAHGLAHAAADASADAGPNPAPRDPRSSLGTLGCRPQSTARQCAVRAVAEGPTWLSALSRLRGPRPGELETLRRGEPAQADFHQTLPGRGIGWDGSSCGLSVGSCLAWRIFVPSSAGEIFT